MGSAVGLGLTLPVLSTIFAGCEKDEGPIITGPAMTGDNVVDINNTPELQSIGGSAKIFFQGYNNGYALLIVRNSETEFLVASAECTHQGCSVAKPASPGATMNCPCHGTRYSSVDGTVVRQPSFGSATTLKKFLYKFDSAENILTIDFNSVVNPIT